MQLYTLSHDFFPDETINEFTSAIWTERFSSAGDFQLVVPPIPSMIELLKPGTFMGLRGQKEIMEVKTQSIETGLLTVTGSSLLEFLNEREAWFINPSYTGADTTDPLSSDYVDTMTAGEFVSTVVYKNVINPAPFTSYWAPINLDWANDTIPGLSLGNVDSNGTIKQLTFPRGALYDGISQLASGEALGIKLYLDSASYRASEYFLKFATYRGKNRTSEQTVNQMVRFSPKLDSLSDVKEITSASDYKNTVYVSYKNQISVHYIPTLPSAPTGFDRRVLLVEAPDIFLTPDHVGPFRQQVALDALAHHIYIQAVDGRVTSTSDYVFGTDYYLGDIIELEGFSGLLAKARVTEYIRSQDQYGEQQYPTLSVIDPLNTGWVGDLEPNPTWTPGWTADPDWYDDWIPADLDDPLKDPRTHRNPRDPNPFDPFDPNPDPLHDFDFPTDGGGGDGGDGGGDGGGDDGGLGVIDSPLVPLRPWENSNWIYDTDRGYYMHRGTVYLCGAANAGINGTTFAPGGEVLLENIPVGMAPEAPVSVQVMIDPLNSSEHFGSGGWLDATVTPDGTLILDAGNPAPSETSTEDVENYAWISLLLSSVSWPTAAVTSDTVSATGGLTGFMSEGSEDWENVDGVYMAHGSRLHLMGSIKAGTTANDNAPLIVPYWAQPAQSRESVGEGFAWCAVCTDEGTSFYVSPKDDRGDPHPLFVLGSGAARSGNKGCPAGTNTYYAKTSDGKGVGESTTLSFTPSASDVGVSYEGFKGSPANPLPESAKWRGNRYSASVSFKVEDIITTAGPLGFPVDYSKITGPDQFAFVMAIAPGMQSYYKVVFTYDTVFSRLSMRLLIEVCGSSTQRSSLADVGLNGLIQPDGSVDVSFNLEVSTDPRDVGYTGTLLGTNYWRLSGLIGSDYSGSVPVPVAGGKGDMGVHIPDGTSCSVRSTGIGGTGEFPTFAPGDIVDLHGAGWPLTGL